MNICAKFHRNPSTTFYLYYTWWTCYRSTLRPPVCPMGNPILTKMLLKPVRGFGKASRVVQCPCLSSRGPRIDPLRFLAGCRRRRLNQGLVVALDSLSMLDRACFCVNFLVSGCMLCLVCYLFIISTSAIDCLGRFVSEMTYIVLSGTLNLTKPKPRNGHAQYCIRRSIVVLHLPKEYGLFFLTYRT